MSVSVTSDKAILPRAAFWLLGLPLAGGIAAGVWYLTGAARLPAFELSQPPLTTLRDFAQWEVTQWILTFFLAVLCALLLVQDFAFVNRWRRVVLRFDSARPESMASWVWRAFLECKAKLDERPTARDLQAKVRDQRAHYGHRLAFRWAKYYLLGFALPLIGLTFGLINLRVKTDVFAYHELFFPLTLAVVEAGVVVGITVIVHLRANDALNEWQSLGEQLAAAEFADRPARADGVIAGLEEPAKVVEVPEPSPAPVAKPAAPPAAKPAPPPKPAPKPVRKINITDLLDN
jgi:hypothetical protein